jgi:nucleotide-binding universal stress UspA family protein
MSEPTKIVFAVDFSEMTDPVVSAAVLAGAGYDSAELHAVCVLDPSGNPLAPTADRKEVERLEEALRARVAASPNAPRNGITYHVCVGSVASEIADLALSLRADLIVVGRHGQSGPRPLGVGSAPVRLLQLTHCSVLIVQPPSYQET